MQAAHFRETFQWLVVRTTRARTAGSSYVSQQTRSQPFRRRHNLTERMLAARACRTSPWLMVRTMGLTNSRAKFRFLGDKDFPVAHGPNNRGTNSRAKFRFERDKLRASQCAGSRREPTHLRGRVGRGVQDTVSGLHTTWRALLLRSATGAKSWTTVFPLRPPPLSPMLILCSSMTMRRCTLLRL
ncbi:uncharacterized protein [Dermacentor albipictus]|uniref:uncharacterized protein isoform X5 n=1 Tax=Dermacentor albipictus TaxID=60249 RepID=UPI0031FCD98D